MLILFAVSLFVSSALLFLVEPMFAKMVLPVLRRLSIGLERLRRVLSGDVVVRLHVHPRPASRRGWTSSGRRLCMRWWCSAP